MREFKRIKVLKQVLEVYDVPLTEQINEEFFKTYNPSISITDSIQVLGVSEFKDLKDSNPIVRPIQKTKTPKKRKKHSKNNS